jgi:HK97 family phage portal protein
VWIITDPSRPYWWEWSIAGTTVDRWSLLHVSAGNRSGNVLGRGVLAQYAEWLGGAVAAEVHAGAYFAGGALPPAVLQSPTVLTQAQADELKAKWREMTSTREPVVLPTGYVLTPVVSNAEQAQLVESRTWNAEAVAMLLGVPSYKLGLPGPSMTYQNVEMADIEFVRDSVDRFGAPLVAAFSKWLMPNGTDVAWDYAGRMRADAKSTAEVLTTYTAAGILSIDEARAGLGRAPLPESAAPPTPDPDPADDTDDTESPDPVGDMPDPTTPADGSTDHV